MTVDYLIGNSDDFGVVNYENFSDQQKNILTLYNSASPQMQSAISTILKEDYSSKKR